MRFRKAFEYRGSYLDLEREKLKVKVWEYRNWTLNHLEAVFEEALLTLATGETHVERDLYKFIKGRRSRRCRISFHLYFQELYDFELSFVKWRLVRISSATSIQRKVSDRRKVGALIAEKSLPKRRHVAERAKYAIQQRRVKKELHKRQTLKDRWSLSAAAPGGNLSSPYSQHGDSLRVGTSALSPGVLSRQHMRGNTHLLGRGGKHYSHRGSSRPSSLGPGGRRLSTSLHDRLSGELSEHSQSRRRMEGGGEGDVPGGGGPFEEIEELFFLHQNTLLLSDEDARVPIAARRDDSS
ncbi:c2 domain-containing, partial [Cystoisospora suis]